MNGTMPRAGEGCCVPGGRRSSRAVAPGGPQARLRAERHLILGSCLILLAACVGDGGAGVNFAVRDSAGIAIVEHTLTDLARLPEWRVSAEPVLDIGVLEGAEPYQLFSVGDAVRLGDGTIVVGNGGTGELRFFDSTGTFRAAAGRKGDGPGEFQEIGGIALVGDSLWVFDWQARRMSVLDRAGRFGRSFLLTASLPGPIIAVGVFRDGTVLARTAFAFGLRSSMTAVVRDTSLFVRIGPDGTFLDSIGRFPSTEFLVSSTPTFAMARSLPFGRQAFAAVGARSAYVGSSDRYEIFAYGSDGTLQRIVRWTRPLRRVTAEDVEAYKAEALENARDDNLRRSLEQMFREAPVPTTMPAFEALLPDAAEHLWVLEPTGPADTVATWVVLDPEGRLAARLSTPKGLRFFEVGADFVLGHWRDDVDVEHVLVYALERGE